MRRVKVTVRSRPISGDRRTLYLDYYPAVRIPETMKMMRQETLGMYLYDKPKNQIQKRHNESTLAQAEAIRCLRVQAVINEEFGFLDKQRLNTDFLEYFRKETLMRNCSWASCYKHFKTFVGGKCTFAQINVDLCVKFREYLLKAPRLILPPKHFPSIRLRVTTANSGVCLPSHYATNCCRKISICIWTVSM